MVKTQKYTYIDSIRGYAVLLVLITHVYGIICHSDKSIVLSKFWIQGRMGVMLFFMISALTLFLSLNQKIKKEKSPIQNFFIRRFFRIAPLFYVVIIFNLLFYRHSLISVLTTISFTNGFLPSILMKQVVAGGGWTIAVEMMFYVLLPIIFKYIKSMSLALMLFIFTLLISIVSKYLMFKYFNYDHTDLMQYTYYWLPAQLPVFSLGIIIYYVLFKTDYSNENEFLFKKVLGYILIFCGIYFSITLSYSSKLFITENIAFSFALILFIIGMAINPRSIFNNKAVQFLGKISYSFYLIHLIIIDIALRYLDKFTLQGNKRFVIATIVILGITSIISYITFLVIEQPFQKLGARIIERLESNKTISELTI